MLDLTDRESRPTHIGPPLVFLYHGLYQMHLQHGENVMLHNKIMKILQIKDVFERPNKTDFLTQCYWNTTGMIQLGRWVGLCLGTL